ncbi:hypothetical protein BDQ12DRAFT_728161 [Crucibulum laeve]|uniref:Association with the SNF1 complex (ASC) domain-containing protein n=1 Tax=Crucibulum laeve TaxID=68775 RepID=A0A5C3LIY6_9AGAR|nr:hypothetical protein BDQ12DRAFT_728161 [Crucibulum laeve]
MGNAASNSANSHNRHHPPNKSNTESSHHHSPSPSIHRRNTSSSPSPGVPHRSLRTKKKSLELPDLASLTFTNVSPAPGTPSPSSSYYRPRSQHPPTKTASIPIPTSPAGVQPERPPQSFPSAADVVDQSTHVPFPPPSRGGGQAYFRGTQGGRTQQQQQYSARQQAATQRIQELYNQSQQSPHVPAPPPSPSNNTPGFNSSTTNNHSRFVQETVQSSIPIALGKAVVKGGKGEDDDVGVPIRGVDDLAAAEPVEVKITWRGGGRNVVLARAGDDEWKGRQTMDRESPTSLTFQTTVLLLPGTHHIRFLVDDQWRVADDYPTAVDDQGGLANYVAVPIGGSYSPQPTTTATTTTTTAVAVPGISLNGVQPLRHPQAHHPVPGQSFWSAASSTDGDDGDSSNGHDTHPHTSSAPPQTHHPSHSAHAHPHSHSHSHPPRWTDVLPPELIEAAKEEELYLQASAGHDSLHPPPSSHRGQQHGHGGHVTVSGFVPAPNIPPAPGLPRHLDKLILNSRVASPQPGGGGSPVSKNRRREGREKERRGEVERSERERERSDRGGGEWDRDRGERERGERDRGERERRDRERGDRERGEREREGRRGAREERRPPPPPPPSEDGSGAGLYDVPDVSPVRGGGGGIEEVEEPKAAAASNGHAVKAAAGEIKIDVEATPTPGAGDEKPSTESTPTNTVPSSVVSSPPSTVPTTPNPGSSVPSYLPPSALPSTSLAPPPSSSNTSSNTSSQPSSHPPTPFLSSNPSHPTTPLHDRPSPSRAITIDAANMPSLTDDGSVLPVPSHVVLHHLSTSAIRNGVLAVGNTTRYRKKYLTTIYYKPT